MAILLDRLRWLSEGADFWVFPLDTDASMVRDIDWYLNLQLNYTLCQKRKEVSPTLQSIWDSLGDRLPEKLRSMERVSDIIMIESSKFLPNQRTVFIAGNQDTAWFEKAFDTFSSLHLRSWRVFLGPDFKKKQDYEELTERFCFPVDKMQVVKSWEESHQ